MNAVTVQVADTPPARKMTVPIRRVEIANHPFVRAVDILPMNGADDRPSLDYPYLSNSQLNSRKCGVKYYFKYARGIREPDDSALLRGTAVHSGAAHFLEAKRQAILTGTFAQFDAAAVLDAAKDVARAVIELRMGKTEPLFMKPRYQKGPRSTAESLIADVDRALELASSAFFSRILPVAVEQGYVIHWKDESVLPFLGYADVISDLRNNRNGVVDFKTSMRAKTDVDLRVDDGITGYALGHELAHGVSTRDVRYGVVLFKKEIEAVWMRGERRDLDFQILFSRCKISTFAIAQGVYEPARDGQSCNGCFFAGARCDNFLAGIEEAA